jgi:hypothetical protein
MRAYVEVTWYYSKSEYRIQIIKAKMLHFIMNNIYEC